MRLFKGRSTARLRILTAIATFAALAPVGCGDPVSVPALLRRQFILTSVGGSPLPFVSKEFTTVNGTHYRTTELADTLQLLDETNFLRSAARYDESPQYPPETFRYTQRGTYRIRRDTLITSVPTPSPVGPQSFDELFIVTRSALRVQRFIGPFCVENVTPCANELADFVFIAR